MKRSIFSLLAIAVALSFLLSLGVANAWAAAPQPLLKVGFAERDITPDIGMEQPGGYGKAFHRTLHDPCKVRASVFDDGKQRVALVGIDALFVRRPLVEAVRKAVHEKCGIAPEAILIGASHSHSSGPTCMVVPGEYDFGSPLVKSLAYEKSSCADPKYLQRVEKQLIAAIVRPTSRGPKARCGVGKGIEDKVAFNRRFRMKSGLVVHPSRPTQPRHRRTGRDRSTRKWACVGVWNHDGKCLGCVVNYACHATCSPGGISANWIYYMEQTIRGAMGKDCVVVFLQGACGDITQVNNQNPFVKPAGEDWCRLVGGRIGAEAVKVLLTMARGPMGPVDVRREMLEIRRRVPSPEHVKKALEMVQQPVEGRPYGMDICQGDRAAGCEAG